MPEEFKHGSLQLTEKNQVVFTSYSKKNFYLRSAIAAFILRGGDTPVSPFMNFEYNLSGLVHKDLIRIANNTMIRRSEGLWVFGEVSDGVMMEIYLAKKYKKNIRYFLVTNSNGEFREIDEDQVILEDVSPWMWEWVMEGKDLERWHPRLRFYKEYPLVYPAYSKRNFFWQMHISQFCLEKKMIPLNPFMLFRYFLGDSVPREAIYRANANIVRICDEVWTFGEIADGVLSEVKLKKSQNHPVKYFKITNGNPVVFRKIPADLVVFEEPELEKYRDILLA